MRLRPRIGLALIVALFSIGLAGVAYRFFVPVTLHLQAPFEHPGGSMWAIRLPQYASISDKTTGNTSRLRLFEDGVELGSPHSLHEDIRNAGRGRYSHWDDYLLFSTSDNSNPNTNGRAYTLHFALAELPWSPSVTLALLLGAASIVAVVLTRNGPGKYIYGPCAWLVVNVLPGVLISGVCIVLVFAIGEAYIRLTRPLLEVRWPTRFDPAFGFNFEPNSEVAWTNLFDFSTVEKANSLGFLDREPGPRSENCHVAIIGDSFVEAAQVSNENKVQAYLEQIARSSRPHLNLSASAFGYSGTGQLNQLPFYDVFARPQKPHVVILVFVQNDFRNNSAVLEAIANGWDPDHAPRVFAEKTADHGYALTRIDPEWQSHLLPVEAPANSEAMDRLRKTSAFFDWGYRKLRIRSPRLFEDFRAMERAYKARYQILLERDKYAGSLGPWDYAKDEDPTRLDSRFSERDLAPPFVDAIGFTKFAIQEFKNKVEQDHGHLMILATSQLSLLGKRDDPGYRTRQLSRLRSIAAELGVPVVDQYEYIVAQGADPHLAQFHHDGHWSVQGHQWAAGAIWDYLQRQDKVCH